MAKMVSMGAPCSCVCMWEVLSFVSILCVCCEGWVLVTWDWEGSHEPLAAQSFCSPSPEREVCVDRWEIYSDSEAVIFVYSHSEVRTCLGMDRMGHSHRECG